jgi:imidazoleglycerol phosphate dehydratase HisB
MAMTARTATISRKTNETEIQVYINLDCQPGSASQQIIEVSTGIGFLDHVRPSTEPSIIFFLHTSGDQRACIDVPRRRKTQRHVSHAEGKR